MTSRQVRTIGLLTVVLVLAACSDEQPSDGATNPPGSAALSVAESSAPASTDVSAVESTTVDTTTDTRSDTVTSEPVDTVATATTVPPPVATAAPTPAPTAPVRADLVLRATGVGTAEFGQSDVTVLTYTTSILGTPISDQLGAYPDTEDGFFVNADDDAFVQPHSRSTCYDNQFCVYFGGPDPDALVFTGYAQDGFELVGDPLQTVAGFTVGDRVSGFVGDIQLDEGGCFSSGSGDSDGVTILLVSDGDPFVFVDEAGNFITGTPDPASLMITGIESGDRPFFLFADC